MKLNALILLCIPIYKYFACCKQSMVLYIVVEAHCYVNDIKWSHFSIKQRSTMNFSDDKGIHG